MMEESSPRGRPRRVWVAVALSLMTTGLGQVYCGRIVHGLLFAGLGALSVPICLGLLARGGPTSSVVFLTALAAAVGVQAVALVDAVRLARRTRPDYALKEYNHWLAYLMLMVIGSGGGITCAFYFREKCVQAFRIPVASMYPTIAPGDRVLANKTVYARADPKVGDVVVFPNPDQRAEKYIKRVVATAGQTVAIRGGVVYVDGRPLAQQAAPEDVAEPIRRLRPGRAVYETNGEAKYLIFFAPAGGQTPKDYPPAVVPKHHVFCLGDNRNHSKDSRTFGPIPVVGVIGRVEYLYLPGERWERFGRLR